MKTLTMLDVRKGEQQHHEGRVAHPFTPPTAAQYADKMKRLPASWQRESKGVEWYVREYRAGWAASMSGRESRKYNEGTYSFAWEDGYLDAAAGRARWHLAHCPNHDECGWG